MIRPRESTKTSSHLGSVLVVDDHPRARESMADTLRCAGHTVFTSPSAVEALHRLEDLDCDVVISDLRMPGMSGIEFVRELDQQKIDIPIVMVTAHASVDSAVEAMRYGAFDYIEKPINAEQLENLVRRALDQNSEASQVHLQAGENSLVMIGDSSAMQQMRQRIARISPTSETVLITGESGTGKELVARSIHQSSDRREKTLIGLNCPALSPQLMESELFGHEQGAFTSADAPRIGRFELADKSSMLLDEVTEIDLDLQAKLLRVLQERTYERVGSSVSQPVDVRILATTNRDLQEEVHAKRFRQDLYYRLNVLPIYVPALRERREDIPALAVYFLEQAAERIQQHVVELDGNAMDLLTNYDWPGNVRELQNVMTRLAVLAPSNDSCSSQLREWLVTEDASLGRARPDTQGATSMVGTSLQEMERQMIEATLQHFHGHRAHTAKALGIGVRTLANKLRSYGYGPRCKVFDKSIA